MHDRPARGLVRIFRLLRRVAPAIAGVAGPIRRVVLEETAIFACDDISHARTAFPAKYATSMRRSTSIAVGVLKSLEMLAESVMGLVLKP
jgi:hypothetical protein